MLLENLQAKLNLHKKGRRSEKNTLNTHDMCGEGSSMVGEWSVKDLTGMKREFVDINLLTDALAHNLD